jgi:hypothetical protein
MMTSARIHSLFSQLTESVCADEPTKACLAELTVTEMFFGGALLLAILVAVLLMLLPRMRRSAILAKPEPKAEV